MLNEKAYAHEWWIWKDNKKEINKDVNLLFPSYPNNAV
jgi:hypothetical protein